ncbi:hypothetical protein HWV62_12124 [Athelia sp. TMB]|nr:hypothetical protein HWV62_12124 [Athelia sp. TMB]
MDAFKWPTGILSTLPEPNDVQLIAPPAEEALDGWEYPSAPRYELVCDERYLRGWVARASYDTRSWADVKRKQVAVKTPPIDMQFVNGKYTMQPIPGCIRATPGMSYCEALDGDPENTVTVAACHTLQSLREILTPAQYTEFERTAVNYACNMWGCKAAEGRPARVAIYTREGLKRNDRSSQDVIDGSFDGSYSLATTVGKGEGRGCVLPAAQIDGAEAQAQIKEMLSQIAFMGTTVLEVTLSRFETQMIKFHMHDNNVMYFGDSGPSFTGVQLNISSTVEDLASAIGAIQGDWHADQSDDFDYWTVCILLLRLSPGSDPGLFFLGRHGIYFHEPGVWILILVFSGSHVHRGTAPRAPPPGTMFVEEVPDDVRKVWHQVGRENRSMTVAYVSLAATRRAGSHAITPPAYFGNEGNSKAHKDSQRTFSEHGQLVLGNFRTRFNRLGSELIYQFYNSMKLAGLDFVGHSMEEIARMFSFKNEDGETMALDGPPIDIIQDADSVALYRGWVTKEEIFETRLALRLRGQKNTYPYPPTEIKTMLLPQPRSNTSSDPIVLTNVLERRVRSNQAEYLVTAADQNEATWMTEPDMTVAQNRTLMSNFLASLRPADSNTHGPIVSVHNSHPKDSITTTELLDPIGPQAEPGDLHTLDNRPELFSSSTSEVTNSPKITRPPSEGWHSQSQNEIEDISMLEIQPESISGVATRSKAEDLFETAQPHSRDRPAPPRALSSAEGDDIIYGQSELIPSATISEGPDLLAVAESSENQIEDPNILYPQSELIPVEAASRMSDLSQTSGEPSRKRVLIQSVDEGESEIEIENSSDCDTSGSDFPPPRKKRRMASGSGRNGSSSVEEEDGVYEVEQIGAQITSEDDGPTMMLVAWKGFDDESNTWEPEENLSNAPERLADFRNATKQTKRTVTIAKPSIMKALQLLFNQEQLDTEVRSLEAFSEYATEKGANDLGSFDLNKLATNLVTHSHEAASTNDVINSVPLMPDSENMQWSQRTACLALTQATIAAATMPENVLGMAKLDILKRCTGWYVCRSTLALFRWHAQLGPSLVYLLMKLHHADTKQGSDTLRHQFPAFTRLVDRIVKHCWRVRNQQNLPKNTAGRSKSDCTLLDWPARWGDREDGALSGDIPEDMYGLKNLPHTHTRQKTLSLPKQIPAHGKSWGCTDNALYELAAQCLLKFWRLHLFNDGLRLSDAWFSNSRQRARNIKEQEEHDTAIFQRTIARGALLHALATITGGEGIFMAHNIVHFVTSPRIIFDAKDGPIAAALCKAPEQTLEPIYNLLDHIITEDIKSAASRLHQLCHRRLLELYGGHALTDMQYQNPGTIIEEMGLPLIPPAVSRKAKKGLSKLTLRPEITIPRISQLFVDERRHVDMSILALIIREGLNDRRGNPAAVEELQRVLVGRHPTWSGSATRDRDQTDPVRMFNRNAARLKRRLPGHFITRPTGISSLLAWMGTGQGSDVTAEFIESEEFFFFEAVQDVIQRFEKTIAKNEEILKTVPPRKRKSHTRDIIAVVNVNIWGQSNNLLGLAPTANTGKKEKAIPMQKFGPYFGLKLVDAWTEFLGEMAGEDPESYTGPRKTWAAGLRWLQDQKLNGFKDGLTLMQTVNNLVIMKILEPPTISAMAHWTFLNNKLGAQTALRSMGFKLTGEGAVRAAMTLIYRHLEVNMTEADKTDLGFGAIFVEHVLCKCTRWDSRLKSLKSRSMRQFAASIVPEAFMPGANKTDSKKFPFPLRMEEAAIVTELRQVVNIVTVT